MDVNEINKIRQEISNRYKLHLRYILLLCILVCLFIILIVPKHVTEGAFQNFSFAATITSIVLAVVSIVYSFTSSGGIATSIGEMKQVEKELEEEIKNIPDLKKHVSETVDDLKDHILEAINENRQASDSKTEELAKSMHDISDQITQLSSKNTAKVNDKTNKKSYDAFDYNFNSFNGNLLLYAIKKAFENNISFNLQKISQILGEGNLPYCRGYIVALYMCNVNRFAYSSDSSFYMITVNKLDEVYFNTEKMQDIIVNSARTPDVKASYRDKMKEIDEYVDSIKNTPVVT